MLEKNENTSKINSYEITVETENTTSFFNDESSSFADREDYDFDYDFEGFVYSFAPDHFEGEPDYRVKFEFFMSKAKAKEGIPYQIFKRDEAFLLKLIFLEGEFLGRGSSRAVFRIADGIVAKVAIDDQGRFQNETELKTFIDLEGEGLAKFYVYSRSIVIMEEVEVLDDDLLQLAFESFESEKYFDELGINEEGYDEIVQVVETLNDYFGYTADNYQIGRSIETGRLVAYDYGFMPGEFERSVSEQLRDIVDGLDNPNDIVFHIF